MTQRVFNVSYDLFRAIAEDEPGWPLYHQPTNGAADYLVWIGLSDAVYSSWASDADKTHFDDNLLSRSEEVPSETDAFVRFHRLQLREDPRDSSNHKVNWGRLRDLYDANSGWELYHVPVTADAIEVWTGTATNRLYAIVQGADKTEFDTDYLSDSAELDIADSSGPSALVFGDPGSSPPPPDVTLVNGASAVVIDVSSGPVYVDTSNVGTLGIGNTGSQYNLTLDRLDGSAAETVSGWWNSRSTNGSDLVKFTRNSGATTFELDGY